MSFSTYRRQLATCVDRLIEWLWQREQSVDNDGTDTEPSRDPSACSGRTEPPSGCQLSIAILPFLSLSREASDSYRVDGIVDALIAELSRLLPSSIVISRAAAFAYKGRAVPIRQVGAELGVSHVLEGSVFFGAHRLRVNVQLIDAATDAHLWAERFDKERREFPQVQDEIVSHLSRRVGFVLLRNEAGRAQSSR
jgi:TolB-like protein